VVLTHTHIQRADRGPYIYTQTHPACIRTSSLPTDRRKEAFVHRHRRIHLHVPRGNSPHIDRAGCIHLSGCLTHLSAPCIAVVCGIIQHDLLRPTRTRHLRPTRTRHLRPTRTRHLRPARTRHLLPKRTRHLRSMSTRHLRPTRTRHLLPTRTRHLRPTRTRHLRPTRTRYRAYSGGNTFGACYFCRLNFRRYAELTHC